MSATLPDRFVGVFRAMFPDYSGPVTPDLTASRVRGWDSVSHGNLIMELEDAYETEIDASAAFACENLGDLARLFQAGD